MTSAVVTPEPVLLEVSDLEVAYRGRRFRSRPFRALRGVSIRVAAGETLGVVGESGSGKTTLGRAILGLAQITGGSVLFRGRDISHVGRRERRALAGDLQVVFQDPYSSLNPSLTIGQTLAEPLTARGTLGTSAARARVQELLDRVHLPSNSAERYPREFSGGQRQRVAIARALALNPRLIVCDEPVSALDLSTQARILDLFREIQADTGVAYVFISHDLAVVRHLSDRVAVMHQGEIVEQGDARQVTADPQHPYTRRLLTASPLPDPYRQAARRAERRLLAQAESASGPTKRR
ncbi:ATP-binding cassette domain-containing protein [Streptomyces sp. NPDC051954]|uniref:ATP-binding cassette domain-containing protein n=1 Tax=unclassified Streptomyces TaxID=2593676 RepID=UPI00343033E3